LKLVLDTNAVSALMKGDAAIIRNLSRTARTDVLLPQPVVAAIAYGLQRLPRSRRRETLRARFDLIRSELARVSWTDEVSEAFGAIKAQLERAGKRIEDFDVAVAAHAMAAGATLVTANLRHMTRIPGLHVEDWSISDEP
jgi:tRNA(fMet)-specific endonuclease VapC